jgi:LacI family transcriptional regulator
MTRNGRVQIRHVAEAAGVSATTVSHVLNEVEGKRVSSQTRERVREAAHRLGYVPNGAAQQLRSQRSYTIGLVGDEIMTTPYAGRMIQGAQEVAGRHGWLLLLLNTNRDPELERREIHALLQGRVDGVLYATMFHQLVRLPPQLEAVPTVLLDARAVDSDVPSVVPDEAGGARAATEELLLHGHQRIGFINNTMDIPASRGRLQGYRAALQGAGVPFDSSLVLSVPDRSGVGYEAASQLLSAPQRPTGLFCYNDRMAMGAYQAAAAHGLSVPQDLSIVGFDDQQDIADNLRPGLSTVALPHYEMGKWAAETLITRVQQPDKTIDDQHAVMTCPLVRRGSVTTATTSATTSTT